MGFLSSRRRKHDQQQQRIDIIIDKRVLLKQQEQSGGGEAGSSTSSPHTASTASSNGSLSSLDGGSSGGAGALQLHGCMTIKTQTESLQRINGSNNTNCHDGKTTKKTVKFSTIEVRTHALLLGDNPSTEYGPPLTISWEPHGQPRTWDVNDYEEAGSTTRLAEARGGRQHRRRAKAELRIPKYQRVLWLLEEGYTRKDLYDAEKRVLAIQRARFDSAEESLASRERKDAIQRTFKKLVLRTKSDKHLYQEWKGQQQQQQQSSSSLSQTQKKRSVSHPPPSLQGLTEEDASVVTCTA